MTRIRWPTRGTSRLLGVVLVAVIIGCGGVAYSACTSSGGCGGSSNNSTCTASLSLVWESYTTPSPSAPFVKCTTTISSSSLLTIAATHLAPGTDCEFFATLENAGTIPATLGDAIDPGSSCPSTNFAYSDNINLQHPEPVISAGGTFLYEATLSLLASAGNVCEGASATFAVTITGTGAVPTLTPPVISVSPATVYSGQSSSLTTTTSFSGGAAPYTCQWFQEAPGASSYSNLGGSFSCASGSLPSTSTGTLSVTGLWRFELRVTDAESVTVVSNIASVTVEPKPVTYSVTFSESGLPSGLVWKVTVAGVTMSLTTNGCADSLTWTGLASGTYAYGIAGNPGWHQSTLPYSGNVVIGTTSVNEPTLLYSQVKYSVTFSETGLSPGTTWSVTLGGITVSSTGSTIVFTQPNGTYSYSVGSISGCTRSPVSGSVTVNGAPVAVNVKFTKT